MMTTLDTIALQEIARVTVAALNTFSRVRFPVPKIKLKRVMGSWYWRKTRRRAVATITISHSRNDREKVDALAHELAHHMVFHLAKDESSHGEFFSRCLRQVIDVMGLDSYDWSLEYHRVRERAARRSH